ncbi:beta-glucanase [gut metagenome]|uniref:Beta-glucanase n=1 Tax=gut metagenome TaxID=749906 RepID=J9GX90_9ZZZZ
MKNTKMIYGLLMAASLWACSEDEFTPQDTIDYPMATDGVQIPLGNFKVILADSSVMVPSFTYQEDGTYLAQFPGIDYSEKIIDAHYLLPEGVSISPKIPTRKDSIVQVAYGKEEKVRQLWEQRTTYTLTKTDNTTCQLTFLLNDFIGKTADENPEPGIDEPGTLFIDLFNSDQAIPDESVWKLCTFAKNAWAQHFEHVKGYETVRLDKGCLKLTVKKDGEHYKNGGIRTKQVFPINTRVEVRAKLTKQVRGGFPAIWQMPNAGPWPVTGEIDIMEWMQGNPEQIYQTIHYDPSGTGKDQSKTKAPRISVTEWHTYAADRTEEAVIFYVDGEEIWRFKNPHSANWMDYPFTKNDFDLILNFSLGGMLNGHPTWPGLIHDEDLPGEMWVDWVKVSAL